MRSRSNNPRIASAERLDFVAGPRDAELLSASLRRAASVIAAIL